MKIACWNVNSLKIRQDLVSTWLQENKPDFLLLQEIKGLDEEVFSQFKNLNYNSYYNLQKAYNGVATLSKHTCEITTKNLPNFKDTQARILEVKYKDILIINCYVPNGNPLGTEKYDYKLKWLQALYDYIKLLVYQNKNFIIAGDFNIAPRDIDVYSVSAFKGDALTQKEIRDIYHSLLNLGLLDVINHKYKNQNKVYTWWDYRNSGFAKNNGLRIDHILLSALLADRYTDTWIDKKPRLNEKPSDHTPVICTLNYN